MRIEVIAAPCNELSSTRRKRVAQRDAIARLHRADGETPVFARHCVAFDLREDLCRTT